MVSPSLAFTCKRVTVSLSDFCRQPHYDPAEPPHVSRSPSATAHQACLISLRSGRRSPRRRSNREVSPPSPPPKTIPRKRRNSTTTHDSQAAEAGPSSRRKSTKKARAGDKGQDAGTSEAGGAAQEGVYKEEKEEYNPTQLDGGGDVAPFCILTGEVSPTAIFLCCSDRPPTDHLCCVRSVRSSLSNSKIRSSRLSPGSDSSATSSPARSANSESVRLT